MNDTMNSLVAAWKNKEQAHMEMARAINAGRSVPAGMAEASRKASDSWESMTAGMGEAEVEDVISAAGGRMTWLQYCAAVGAKAW